MKIGFTVQYSNFQIPFPTLQLKNWLNLVAGIENTAINNIEYILVNDKEILEINSEFLHHGYYTDIITFNYNTPFGLSGEVFISIDTMIQNSQSYEVSESNEFLRLLVHGLLHLIGFEDATVKQKAVMRHKEEHYIKLFYQKIV